MDDLDKISENVRTETCPYCFKKFEDLDAGVARSMKNGHIRRHHPFEEE